VRRQCCCELLQSFASETFFLRAAPRTASFAYATDEGT
jgi:hypothetical protein